MRLRGTLIPLVTGADIDHLVADQVIEDERLDFKTTLYLNRGSLTTVPADEAAVAFCKDVTSMANARGGVIVCGVAENNGIASKVTGVPAGAIDQEKRWIDSTLRQRVQPNIPGLQVSEVTTAAGSVVLLIGVPASLARPHGFTPASKQAPQWWRRGLAGNQPMDVAELRALFLEMGTWERDAAAWREERFHRIQEGSGVPPLPVRPIVVVHMQPLGGPRDPITGSLGFTGASPVWLANFLPQELTAPFGARPNIDGWQYSVSKPQVATYHAQVFRATGAVEVRLDPAHLNHEAGPWDGRHLAGPALERLIVRTVKTTFLWAESKDLVGPFLVSVRLTGVMNVSLTASSIPTRLKRSSS